MSYKDSISAVDVLKLDGSSDVVGTPTITVLKVDSDNNVLLAKGATVPTDTDAGYAKGCIFIYTSGTVGTTIYVNEGSATSADFNQQLSTSGSPTLTGVSGLTLSSTFGTTPGATGAGILRFAAFSDAFTTATGTAFTGDVYNILIQVPGVGTAYIKATTTV